MDNKYVKLKSNLAKYLLHHNLEHSLFAQIERHCDFCYDESQMNQEIIYCFLTLKVDSVQNVKWLELWNQLPHFVCI